MQKQRAEIGRIEDYALEWEKDRLAGARLEHLIQEIEDRRDRPGYGHDFLPYSAENEHRYIEVKCSQRLATAIGSYLSDNEHQTSQSADCRDSYYFYLVFFDGNRNPVELLAIHAAQLYRKPRCRRLPMRCDLIAVICNGEEGIERERTRGNV